MNRSQCKNVFHLLCAVLLVATVACAGTSAAQESPILSAMTEELQRSFAQLHEAEDEPLYYLRYTITHQKRDYFYSSEGALVTDWSAERRLLDLDLRVGSFALDCTHEIRGGGYDDSGYEGPVWIPIEDDPDAVKAFLWQETDRRFKSAQERLINVKANQAVKVEEEHEADDFSPAPVVVHIDDLAPYPDFDRDEWKARLKELSRRLQPEPYILSGVACLDVLLEHRFTVTSEGTRIQTSSPSSELNLTVWGIAQDGMTLSRAATFYAAGPGDLPDDDALNAAADRLVDEFRALYSAPVVEPYHGPAILMNKAAGVFFHEIFGHRIEGHRQKMSEEGQTFTDKVGKQVLPAFLSVVDDPTLRDFDGTLLTGCYEIDDEGVEAQRVAVVEGGILRNFLMSRSPIEGFAESNGHGRGEPGYAPVSRQGNLIVESETQVPVDRLKEMLIEECRKQGKEYGLIFDDISGGFTMTQRGMPQAFKVIPLLVRRVYVDGRPDDVVRGVDIVGTPLASFSKIIATGDDPAVFNGICGAESGSIHVSAVAPSILLGEIEIEKQEKSQDKPPILAPPDGESDAETGPDAIFAALSAEIDRSMAELKMEASESPYYVEYMVGDRDEFSVSASFGALISQGSYKTRELSADVRVGDYSFDNTNFESSSYSYGYYGGYGAQPVSIEDDYNAMRRAAWLATDAAYKQAVEDLAAKKACVQNRRIEDRPPDMSREEPYQHFDDPVKLDIDTAEWTDNVRALSGLFREYPWIQSSTVQLEASTATQHFANNEGFKHRRCGRGYMITVSATAQADDGMKLADGFTVAAREPDDIPTMDELRQRVADAAARLKTRCEAAPCDDYSGPVLLSGEAAATLIDSLFVYNLYGPREPIWQDDEMATYSEGNLLVSKLGLRVFPDWIDVVDDPTARKFGAEPLVGWYTVDDDGVAPQKITLVSDGKFVMFPMSRIPIKEIQGSNGHGRGDTGDSVDSCPSNVIVVSADTVSPEELKGELISRCKDEGLDYGIMIDSFAGSYASDYEAMWEAYSGDSELPAPGLMYRVSAADGTQTPVRDANPEGVTLRALRDIVAVSDKPEVTNLPGEVKWISIVSPAMLIGEMDLRKLRGEKPEHPYLKHPYFENE
jgi:predicted Zn-dependent protease